MRRLRAALAEVALTWRYLTTPQTPPEEVAVRVLARLSRRDSVSTLELYRMFPDGRGVDGPVAHDWVTLARLYVVLEDLERSGCVRSEVRRYEDRPQAFWTLHHGGGSRQQSRPAPDSLGLVSA